MIEQDIEGIKSELVSLRCLIQEIHEKVLPKPKDQEDFSDRTEKALATGKEPRKKSTQNV